MAAISDKLAAFEEIWILDTEFHDTDDSNPHTVVCVAGVELRSGRRVNLWHTEFGATPPFRTDDKVLHVYFAATAECCSFLALGWPLPHKLLDLSPEFRLFVNGRISDKAGKGLLAALKYFGLPHMSQAEKDYWRYQILAGSEARDDILKYCMVDVDETVALLHAMLPNIDLPRALFRSDFVRVSAKEEHRGLPIDTVIHAELRHQPTWDAIRERLIPDIDAAYGVYEGRVFKTDLFQQYLARNRTPWPLLDSGKLDLKTKTFSDQAKHYPQLDPLHDLRVTLSQMRRVGITAGADGRSRTTLWPFTAKTSRTQPKASRFLFGPARWIRSLIKPGPGMAIAYVDWSAMEFGIAAALSGDTAMLRAYIGGDPYLGSAIAMGYAPPSATKKSHKQLRDAFKVVLLAAQYGMGPVTLAARLGISTAAAAEILQQHRRVYARYWQWSEARLHRALASGRMWTCFGWTRHLDHSDSINSLQNWAIQSHGAEILRTAAVWADKYGLQLVGTVHDAILLEAPSERISRDVELLQEIMLRASRVVLSTPEREFALRSDATIVRYPERYVDGSDRGIKMWAKVNEHLTALCGENRHHAAA
jgi:DNA polymerase I